MTRRKNELQGAELDVIEKTLTSEILPFDKAMTIFIKDAKRKALREFTIKYYLRECNDFRNYLAREEHSLIINEVLRRHIDEFIEDMQQRRHLQTVTINTKLRAIRTLFNFLYDRKFISENPMQKYPLLKDRKANISTFSNKQLRQLFNAPNMRTFTGQRDYTFMLLLLDTGIRLNEAAGILVEDVKLSEGSLFIRNTKNHFHRYVPITAKTKAQLSRYLKLRGTCETDHLFVTIDETALTRAGLQKVIPKYGKLAGIKGVRCSAHTIRHTFAKLAIMNGAGIFEVQKILGHSSMEMVRVYVNLFSSEVAEKHKGFSPLNNFDF
ncbi:tyrosine-type recombinase/integrase [Aquibacillus saliphilus]|uniref:tyrosine-type recombinase/integrase n=1 Tax=Aquibacillus saliphilus TaxID=1909422 RepID=UPI001CF04F4A|nr:tyrosine-type recombinase/integrase [Aquibacillus saliphilus]